MDADMTAHVRQILEAATIHTQSSIEWQVWVKAALRGHCTTGCNQSQPVLGCGGQCQQKAESISLSRGKGSLGADSCYPEASISFTTRYSWCVT